MLERPHAVRSVRQVDQCGQGFRNGSVGQHQRRRALAGGGVAGHLEQHPLPFVHHGLHATTGGLERCGCLRVRVTQGLVRE